MPVVANSDVDETHTCARSYKYKAYRWSDLRETITDRCLFFETIQSTRRWQLTQNERANKTLWDVLGNSYRRRWIRFGENVLSLHMPNNFSDYSRICTLKNTITSSISCYLDVIAALVPMYRFNEAID